MFLIEMFSLSFVVVVVATVVVVVNFFLHLSIHIFSIEGFFFKGEIIAKNLYMMTTFNNLIPSETQGYFKPILAKSILKWRKFKNVQIRAWYFLLRERKLKTHSEIFKIFSFERLGQFQLGQFQLNTKQWILECDWASSLLK